MRLQILKQIKKPLSEKLKPPKVSDRAVCRLVQRKYPTGNKGGMTRRQFKLT